MISYNQENSDLWGGVCDTLVPFYDVPISCGLPRESGDIPPEMIRVPGGPFSSTQTYVIKASGDSMEGVGIYDGDRLMVEGDLACEGALTVDFGRTTADPLTYGMKIPLAEVAKRVRALGFEGVDIWSSTRRATIKLYRDAGFAISCVIWFSHFDERYDEAKGREIVEKAVANGCDRILVVPATKRGSLAGDPAVRALVIERTERYAAYAAEKGVVVTIEDYDDNESPTADIANTKDFLKRAPHVRLAFDTGNFYFRGESAEDALKELAGSVSHFHLKDRPVESRDTKYSVAFGTGAISARSMIELSREAWGYDGWFTLEHFGVTNMLETIETSAKFLFGKGGRAQ